MNRRIEPAQPQSQCGIYINASRQALEVLLVTSIIPRIHRSPTMPPRKKFTTAHDAVLHGPRRSTRINPSLIKSESDKPTVKVVGQGHDHGRLRMPRGSLAKIQTMPLDVLLEVSLRDLRMLCEHLCIMRHRSLVTST